MHIAPLKQIGYFLMLALVLISTRVSAFEDASCQPLQPGEQSGDQVVAYSDSLLWRISAPELPDSWLFGTMHLGDEEITQLPHAVTEAFATSSSLVTEVRMDSIDPAVIAGHYFYPDQQLLQQELPAALYSRLLELLQPYGIPHPMVARMRPHAAYLTLSGPVPGSPPPLDQVLFERARQQGKELHGLESVAEQLQTFDVLTDQEQVVILLDVICHDEQFKADRDQLRQHYLEGNIAALVSFTDKYQDRDADINERLMHALIDERNLRMAKRLLPILQQGSVFVAVGALHLPGQQGLVALLEAAGFQLQPVLLERQD